jgi:hypothetical protein
MIVPTSSPHDASARNHAIARVDDDALRWDETIEDLRLVAVPLPQHDRSNLRAAIAGDEDSPSIVATKERSFAHANDFGALPRHDSSFDAVAVSEACPLLPRIIEIQDDIDALLFDAKLRRGR